MAGRKDLLLFLFGWLWLFPGFSQEPIPSSVHVKDQIFNSGIFNFLAYDSISMSNTIVGSGADLTLRSLNLIILGPGVDISQGATFQVYADNELISRLIEEGNNLASNGDYDGAIAKLEQVLEIYPGHVLANYTLGLIYDKKGDSGAAIAYLEKVLLLAQLNDPLIPQTHYRLGLWKFPEDPYNYHFEKVLELVVPDDPLALMVKDARINYHF
ncbi:MAG: tetratricopeptide repeat protein, partial [Saprospiraceae bacterium]|nr:tetratricopeptide repeat protein [Saprospiraceae bacterium]